MGGLRIPGSDGFRSTPLQMMVFCFAQTCRCSFSRIIQCSILKGAFPSFILLSDVKPVRLNLNLLPRSMLLLLIVQIKNAHMKTKSSFKMFWVASATLMVVLISQSAHAQKRDKIEDKIDKREDVRDRRENVRDRKENKRDRREDVRDRREDKRDALHDGGRRDKLEDIRDKREDVRDHKEDVRDRKENIRDRKENKRDRREDRRDRRH